MTNGWTGGQYSLFRAILGAYLAVHFLRLFPDVSAARDTPATVVALLATGTAAAVLLTIGLFDRPAALIVCVACLFGRSPLSPSSLPYVAGLLLAHVFVSGAPYGSWAARGRADPDGGWRLLPRLFAVGWILMASSYVYSGYARLASPSWADSPALVLELGFAPLSLFRSLRPWAWSAMVALNLGRFSLLDVADPTAGLLLLHLWTFDPAWVPGRRAAGRETLFYDGHCGLCHRWVRFTLAEDAQGQTLRFAPLQGEAAAHLIPPDARRALPDSLVVQTTDGRLLTRSSAVLHILARLGGYWRVIGVACGAVPRPLRDAAYDAIAAVRYQLFARPADVCPLIPSHLRARFNLE